MASPNPRLRSVDCLTLIEQRLPALTGASRAVGEAIVRDPWAILGMTIYDVAETAQVSLPSVTRFCRAVGYTGFRELVQGIAQSLGRLDGRGLEGRDTPTADSAGLPGIAAAIVKRQVDALQAALTTIDFAQMDAAMQALIGARSVFLVGHGSAHIAASGIAFKLNWAGITATAVTPDIFSNILIGLKPEDVVISISIQGRTRDVVEMQALAKQFGATTIGLSMVERSPLASGCDIPIIVLSPELARAGTFLVSYNALLVVGDILASGILDQRGSAPTHRDDVSDWMETALRVGPLPAVVESPRARQRRAE